MNGERILVVDDEPEILRCLRPALTACGYEVLSAETGRSALHAIASRAPDLVLLDLGLPDMDGKSVITQAGAFSKAPIVVLSARDREAEKISALDAGAVDYVEKPSRSANSWRGCAPPCATPPAKPERSSGSSAAGW